MRESDQHERRLAREPSYALHGTQRSSNNVFHILSPSNQRAPVGLITNLSCLVQVWNSNRWQTR